MDKNR